MYHQPGDRVEKMFLFFLIREKTLFSLAFECGRIRTVWLHHSSYKIYDYHSPSFKNDRYPKITSMLNWVTISRHFLHLQASFGLHPRLSSEYLHYSEAVTPQTLCEVGRTVGYIFRKNSTSSNNAFSL